MRTTYLLVFKLAFLTLFNSNVSATVAFEGYYRIEKNGTHYGFLAVKEEFDPAKKIWVIRYMIQNIESDHRVNQIRAMQKQDAHFKPISSEYEEWVRGNRFRSVMIFSGDKFEWKVDNGGLSSHGTDILKKNEFFLSSLHHLLPIHNLAKGKSYPLNMLKENTGHVIGHARVLDEKTIAGKKIFKVSDEDSANPEEYWISSDREVIMNHLPKLGLTVILVSDLDQATGHLDFDRAALASFFGGIPSGKANLVSQQNLDVSAAILNVSYKSISTRDPASAGQSHIETLPSSKTNSKK